jgi:outer membrane protein
VKFSLVFKRHPVAVLLCGLVSSVANSADLSQVYQLARQNDAQFAEAKARYEGGLEKLTQGRAFVLPSLLITGAANSVERRFTDPATTPWTRFQNHQYALTLSQPLFRWQNWLQYEQGGLQVAQAEADFAQAQQDLVLRAAQAYFDVLAADENVRSFEKQLAAIDQQLAQAKAFFEVGTATITDTHEAQARQDLAGAQLIAARSDLEIKRSALQILTGEPVETFARLQSDVVLSTPEPQQLAHWVNAAEEHSPTVQSRLAAAEIAKLEASKQQAGHLPTLDLVGSMGKSRDYTLIPSGTSFEMGLANINQNMVGVQLNIPLFQGGAVSSRAREAAAGHLAAKAAFESSRRLSAQNARQAFLSVVNGLAQVKALSAAVESSKLALDSNKLGYEVGVRINIDVLNADQQLQSTTRDLTKARFETLISQLKLKAAIGSLGENDLNAVNLLLQSE